MHAGLGRPALTTRAEVPDTKQFGTTRGCNPVTADQDPVNHPMNVSQGSPTPDPAIAQTKAVGEEAAAAAFRVMPVGRS
jgi:hypothetical protein